jgi:cytochrome c2
MKKLIISAVILGALYLLSLGYSNGITPPLLVNIATTTVSAEKLTETTSTIIKTAYFSIEKRNFMNVFNTSGRGGALTSVDDDHIVYATNSGDFFQINTKTMSVINNYLPHLDNGRTKISTSKFYTYRESQGRIHDILHFNGDFYVSYDAYVSESDRIHFEISKYDKIKNIWVPIYKSVDIDVHHFSLGSGGKMTPYYKNNILFSVGDFSIEGAPQNPLLPFGKVIKLDTVTGDNSIISMGHRNNQGLTVLKNGSIIASEHGPRGGDELNHIKEKGNYGWPLISFGTHYNSYTLIDPIPYTNFKDGHTKKKQNEQQKKYTKPFYSFVPSIAPTDIIQINNVHALWDSNLLLGSLKAMSLFHIRIDTDKSGKINVIFAEPIYIGSRIRDIEENSSKIWMLLDDGSISSLTPINSKKPSTDNISGLASCMVCHTIDPENNSAAPSFRNIFNRRIATSSFDKYSNTLKLIKSTQPNLIWSDANLLAFIKDPQLFAPGTTMFKINPNITEEAIKDIIARLKELN